jgi:hypothetical protein
MYKTHQVRTIFGSWDVEKVPAVVVRSTYRSQNVKSTRGSDHFWKLRCRKSVRRCGAKHISKSKTHKILGFRSAFRNWAVEKVVRSTFPSQKYKKLTGTEYFWAFKCRFAKQA